MLSLLKLSCNNVVKEQYRVRFKHTRFTRNIKCVRMENMPIVCTSNNKL